MLRHLLLTTVAVAVMAGCVQSYRGLPPLPYAEVPYTGPDEQAWTEKKVELPEIATGYAIGAPVRIHYVELNPQGSKGTLVFVHGLGSYLKFWRYQLDHYAAAGWRVLALDMVGYGKSDKPASFPYTMEAMANVVHAFAKQTGADDPVLIGHSMGGQTALSYAIRYPDALRALVLTSPAGFEKFSRREKLWFRDVFTVALIRSASEESIWGSVRQGNFHQWKDEFAWLVEERVRVVNNGEFSRYAYANVKSVHGLSRNDFVRDNLADVKVPTLIVHGDRDRLIPNPYMHGGTTRDIMAYGHEGIAGSELVTLEGCGHTVQMDCSQAYNAAVDAFLAGAASVGRVE